MVKQPVLSSTTMPFLFKKPSQIKFPILNFLGIGKFPNLGNNYSRKVISIKEKIIMKVKVKDLKKVIKEEADRGETQREMSAKFSAMTRDVSRAIDKFTDHLININVPADVYKNFMDQLSEVLEGLTNINMSKVKFLSNHEANKRKETEEDQRRKNVGI